MITGQKNTKGRESGDKGLKCTGGGKTGYGRREIVTPCPPPEKWIHIFSVSIAIIPTRLLCKMQANSSGAEFLSAISKFIKSKKILSLLVYVLHKTWNYRHFHVVVVQWRQRNEQKSVMHVQSCCFALLSYCFFYFLVAAASLTSHYLRYMWSIRNRIFSVQNELLLLIESETFFDSSVVILRFWSGKLGERTGQLWRDNRELKRRQQEPMLLTTTMSTRTANWFRLAKQQLFCRHCTTTT